ncbi:MAG: hypothetical protein M1829_000122 [Trizodia sp. TS-e1964]|nr:MAG: hypothetical protein M1829_000122 [Trizodia sp. TS-e1964]
MSTEPTPPTEEWKPPPTGSPCWIDIPALDVARARAFYTALFAWNFQPATEQYPADQLAMFKLPDPAMKTLAGGIGLVTEGEHRACVGGTVVYYMVDDVDKFVARAEQAGGRVVMPKKSEGGGWIARVADTEGNWLGFYSGPG